MDAPAEPVATARRRPLRALVGLLLLASWIGWAVPALWHQNSTSPAPLCVAFNDRR